MFKKLARILLALGLLFAILTIPTSTRQGVDFVVHTKTIPLYLKMLDFTDRYFNYLNLAHHITKDAHSETEKAKAILTWTKQNIKRVPQGMSIIDDHIWFTIVRGYAVDDQFQDIFATLCNHAGIRAFYADFPSSIDTSKKMPLAIITIGHKQVIFDAYRGNYFTNKKGEFADISILKNPQELVITTITKDTADSIDYSPYFTGIAAFKDSGLSRSSIQSPFKRLMYELKSRFK